MSVLENGSFRPVDLLQYETDLCNYDFFSWAFVSRSRLIARLLDTLKSEKEITDVHLLAERNSNTQCHCSGALNQVDCAMAKPSVDT